MPDLRVGIVGAGQLARMTVAPAIGLGVSLRILANDFGESAARVWPDVILGSPDDPGAIAGLAAGCDVTTFDHELVDTEAVRKLEHQGLRFAPTADVVAVAQSKVLQRRRFSELGLPVPLFAVAAPVEAIERAIAFGGDHGWPMMIKADRGGYDGRGVWTAGSQEEAASIAQSLGDRGIVSVFEQMAPIDQEVAIITARRASGEQRIYPLVETVQVQGMLRELRAPALVEPAIEEEARSIARQIASDLGVTGLLAVEYIVSNSRLLVNEIATRPHNSGHYTIEGSVTSQFEQHLRAILDLPLGDTTLTGQHVVTVNVVGNGRGGQPEKNLAGAMGIEGVHIHLYGKAPRPGRKLGHVTVVSDDRESALNRARRAAELLEGSEVDG